MYAARNMQQRKKERKKERTDMGTWFGKDDAGLASELYRVGEPYYGV